MPPQIHSREEGSAPRNQSGNDWRHGTTTGQLMVSPDRFHGRTVRNVVHEVLHRHLNDRVAISSPTLLARSISCSIRDSLNGKVDERYKLVAHVLIVPQQHQGVNVSHRCIWDKDVDGVVSECFQDVRPIQHLRKYED
eukprot:GHVT01086212.1.p2 GENE.GHVT01086212.1~~GHVT01086212.1.p2  ORF type:complete len:138 (-),score=0.46 GHVT01086212.1:819-1232(-)